MLDAYIIEELKRREQRRRQNQQRRPEVTIEEPVPDECGNPEEKQPESPCVVIIDYGA